MNVPLFPTINASLNALAGVFLVLGWMAIKQGNKERHRQCMIGAVCASTLFLISYVTYHATVGVVTRYAGQGVKRAIYFFILGTHTPLAVLILPFVVAAIWYAAKGNFVKHAQITRWLWPTWIYVSLTGVLVYLMLYVIK